MALGFACASSAQSVPRAEDTRRVEQLVATLAQEAATLCPLSDPGDQDANGITFWIDPHTSKIVVGQFSRQEGADPRLNTASRIPPVFDGKWMWLDDKGEPQPKPALFVGLFRADNPYLEQLQTTYKDLALAMRNGTCNNCHAPDNPEKMKRLVLFQTPAHAAAEIKRVMAAVRDNRMPPDEIGIEKELDAETKTLLLKYGATFESAVNAAYTWETGD